MATFSIRVQNNQILFVVWVTDSSSSTKKFRSYQALFDTGAQLSMISEKVVQECGLLPIGDFDITPVSGEPIKTECYMVRLDIPISQSIKLPDGKTGKQSRMHGDNLHVGNLPYNPANYDVLIGMVFIRLFHITMFGGLFLLSN